MKFIKYLTLLLAFLFYSFSAFSQNKGNDSDEKNNNKFKDKIFIGGSFSLQFGSITAININPVIGIRPIPRLSLGVGGKYQYYNSKNNVFNNYETHIYGGNIFSEYILVKDLNNILPVKVFGGILSHIEYEALNLETKYFDLSNSHSETDRFWLNSVLIGGGYHQKIGKHSYFYILILWNVTETINTPYSNPVYRIGFVF